MAKRKKRTLQCPKELRPEARAVWDLFVGELTTLGILSAFDLVALVILCNGFADYLRDKALLDKHGAVMKSPNGHLMQSPYVSIVNAHEQKLLRLTEQFGFTPAARAHL